MFNSKKISPGNYGSKLNSDPPLSEVKIQFNSLGGRSEFILDPGFLGEIFLELNVEYVFAIRQKSTHLTLNCCASLVVRVQISAPKQRTGRMMALYAASFALLDTTFELKFFA